MGKLGSRLKRTVLLAGIGLLLCSNSGCSYRILYGLFWSDTIAYCKYFITTPVIPVSPYFSQMIEDTYHNEERYGKVPILDPVEGENAPIYCMDPPSPDEVIRAAPDDTAGGWPFLAETQRNNVRIVVEPLVDKLDECRFYPLAGPARLHHCHYKCTLYYDKIIRSSWPIPFTHRDATVEVVMIDHDHLIRCAGPETPQ
jgi:hypothetical protein